MCRPPPPLRNGHIYMKDAYSAESNEKLYFRFLVFEMPNLQERSDSSFLVHKFFYKQHIRSSHCNPSKVLAFSADRPCRCCSWLPWRSRISSCDASVRPSSRVNLRTKEVNMLTSSLRTEECCLFRVKLNAI